MSRPRDVVVVGAGPAGSATALHLAELGLRVLLLDRAEFPRRKPCGECLNPAAVAALERLGALPDVRGAGAVPLDGWRIGAGDVSFDGSFPPDARGLALSRERLDALLLERAIRAGVEVRTGTRVMDLAPSEGGLRRARLRRKGSESEVAARVIVGADGLRSVVLRRLSLLRRSPRLRKIALTAHVAGTARLGNRGELSMDDGVCVGIAPLEPGRANVTLVFDARDARRVRGDAAGVFDRSLRARFGAGARRIDPVLATGPFDWPVRARVADGALLVGDAAGYFDPFTGQGIYRALRGAELAAAAIHEGLERGDPSSRGLRSYDSAHRREFGGGERLQRLIEAVVSRPRLFARFADRLRASPEVADALIRVVGDLDPVHRLLRPRLLAGMLRAG